MGQGTTEASSITIYIYEVEKFHQITYLGSIIDDTLSLSQNLTDELGEHQQQCLD